MLINRRRIQTGKGLGSILKGIRTSLAPIARSPRVRQLARNLAKQAAKSTVKAGARVLNDAVSGGNILDSLSRNFSDETSNFAQKALEEVKNTTKSAKVEKKTLRANKKRKRSVTSSRKKKKRKRKDIFN